MRPYCCHFILLYPLLLMAGLAVSQQRQRDTLILHFATDRYDLQPGDLQPGDPKLDWLRSSLGAKKIDSVFITGYTDKTGTLSHNLHLSAQRAATAGGCLKRAFTATNKIRWRIAGAGVAPTPEQSDSDNRRAEIVISYVTAASPIAGPASATNPPPAGTPPAATPHPTTSTDSAQLIIVRTDSSSLAAAATADSARPTAVISLQEINFVLDTPIPTAATQTRLPGYVRLLQQYKDRRLEIDGYVNSFVPLRGPKDPLFILSVKRAKYIYDLLIDAGFDPNKLTYKGMGNASPINPDPTTREEMNANMRVEIKVY